MSDDLLPCPFCGAPAELHQEAGGIDQFRWHVGCSRVDVDDEGTETECIAYLLQIDYARKADAIAAWNKRASPAQVCVVFPGNELAHAYVATWDASRKVYVTADPPMATHQLPASPAQAVSVPDGCIVVPIEELRRTIRVLRYASHPDPSPHADALAELIAAAPSPPQHDKGSA